MKHLQIYEYVERVVSAKVGTINWYHSGIEKGSIRFPIMGDERLSQSALGLEMYQRDHIGYTLYAPM